MKTTVQTNQSNEESFFDVSELFISTTDAKGIILSGNDVFQRVAGYTLEEMLGEPHNIIRHPDMPKCVFRLLWDTIKAGQVIAAYVKNRAKDGKYYWVLATVFPVNGIYFSIRMKPTSDVVKIVEGVYKEALAIEKEKGMDASLAYIVQAINGLGFPTYPHFMKFALKTELERRDHAMAVESNHKKTLIENKNQSSLFNIFLEMRNSVSTSSKKLAEKYDVLNQFEKLKGQFQKDQNKLLNALEVLESLAVNMSISAHKLGKEGSTLAIVANNFQNTAKQVIAQFNNFEKIAKVSFEELESVSLIILCSRVQAEMLSFHISEVINKINSGTKTNKKEKTALLKDFMLLIASAKDIFAKSNDSQNTFYQNIFKLKKDAKLLHQLITRLDLIKTGGRLEGSRTSEITEVFKPFVNEMGHFVNTVEEPIAVFTQSLDELVESFKELNSGFRLLEHSFNEIELLIKFANEIDEKLEEAG